jgi:predicted dehydrogenase
MSGLTRREFLGASSLAAVGAGLAAGCARAKNGPPWAAPGAAGKKVHPGDRVTVGFIGVAGRGMHLMDRFMAEPDVDVAAVCDVYPPHLDAAVAKTGGKAEGCRDFRALLDRSDLDAVVVATPPHWHSLISVLAMQAGKDVYCEKPMCLKPVEGRAMVNAARRHGRITQIGTQIHSMENYHRVVEIVQSGVLGDISVVRTQLMLNEAPDGITGNPPDGDPPEGLDWDMWCGPLPMLPYNPARFTLHRYFDELVGSWIHEMGPHIIDLPIWAMAPGPPHAVTAVGGKFATRDISTIPDTLEATFEYDGFIMTWSNMCANSHGLAFHRGEGMGRRLGVSFHGVNGTLLADYGSYELVGEGDRLADMTLPEPHLARSPGHQREFLDCVKSREDCSCGVEYHYDVHVALNLAQMSYKLGGRRLEWDAENGCVRGDREANAALRANYRKPWKLPV